MILLVILDRIWCKYSNCFFVVVDCFGNVVYNCCFYDKVFEVNIIDEVSFFKFSREFFYLVNIFIVVVDEDVIFGFIIWNENKFVGNKCYVIIYICILIIIINMWFVFEVNLKCILIG